MSAVIAAAMTPSGMSPARTGVDQGRIRSAYGQLPIAFEANQGQSDPAVKFLARGRGYGLFLTATEALFSTPSSALRMQLRGANPEPRVTGEDELPGKANYFIGSDPSKWRTSLSTYAKVRYHDVYPGIDLVYYGNGRDLEHDFIVAPGVDPEAIHVALAGVRDATLDRDGDLVLAIEDGGEDVRLRRPVSYQIADGRRQEVTAEYVLADGHDVRFRLGRYDTHAPLVIDPILIYSTYIGTGDDEAHAIAVDGARNVYVAGSTRSTSFPTTANPLQPARSGYSDAFVAKLNAAGSALLYSTYLGGSGSDGGSAIGIDAAGNAYVTGSTDSRDFPTANPLQPAIGGDTDVFVAKLSATGSALLYSTYLGGNGRDYGFGMAMDAAGSAYVTGSTTSSNFPTARPIQARNGGGVCRSATCEDVFVAKLNASGSALVYSTYLGGNDDDEGHAIAVDGSGNAYITGSAASTNFPVVNPFQAAKGSCGVAICIDTFVTKVHADGSTLIYSTYLGGSGTGFRNDRGSGIAVNGSGNAFITGTTYSANFPTANAWQRSLRGYYNAFITKLSPSGSALVYSTFFGGSDIDNGSGIAVDASDHVYISGRTRSSDFPLVSVCGGPEFDAFAASLNAAGSLLSTYCLGGSGNEWQAAIALDGSGNGYVAGYTDATDFPTRAALQPTIGGGGSPYAFVTKFDFATTPLSAPLNLTASAAGSTVTLTWAAPLDGILNGYVIEAGSASGSSNLANFPTGNTSTTYSASGVPGGTYFARVRATNSAGTSAPSNEAVVTVGSSCTPGAPSALAVVSNSAGRVVLQWEAAAGSPSSYVIEAGSGPGLTNLANVDLGLTTTVTATPAAGVYFVRVRARNGCGTSGPSNEIQFTVS